MCESGIGFNFNANISPTSDNIRCIINIGASFAVAGAYTSYGSLVPNVDNYLKIWIQNGLKTDIYMNHCSSKDPVQQANELLDGIPNNLYENIWVSVIDNYSPWCEWSYKTPDANCQYLKSLIMALKDGGKNVGILSSTEQWTNVFKSVGACYQLADGIPLWCIQADGYK